MILKAYSVYDRKALNYNPPFYAPTDGAAIRIVADAANDQNNSLNRHPADFVLFCVGGFDDQTGILSGTSPLQHIIDIQALITQQPPLPFDQRKE